MNAEARLKVKQYKYEREALSDFIDNHANQYSDHVRWAVSNRLGVVNREIKILEGKQ